MSNKTTPENTNPMLENLLADAKTIPGRRTETELRLPHVCAG